MFRQRKLIAAFGIHCLLPQVRPRARREIEHGAGKQRIGGTIGRQDQADRFERFADNQRHPMLGRLQKKLAMNRRRKTGDYNGRHVLQRKLPFAFRSFARQLPVFTTQRALRRVYADDVVGHALIPVSRLLRILARPSLNALI